jgi:PAS domain S-box-containing protein
MCKDISQLTLSEEKFSKMFQINPFICGLTGLSDGVYTEVNDEFVNQLGYSREETIGRNARELGILREEDMPALLAQAGPDGSFRNVRTILRRKDGQLRTMLLSAGNICIGTGQYRYTVAQDITALQQIEETMRRESDFLQTVISQAAEGICVCHAIDVYPHVEFTVWNPRMTEITGYTIEEINRMGWYQTVYPDPEVQQKAIARMSAMRVGDNIRGEEWEITCADGTKKKLLISTSIVMHDNGRVHVLGLMQDITARVQAENKTKALLREKEIVLRETRHRVKNNMAMMHNLFVLQQMHETDRRVCRSLEDAADRVRNMTALYVRLFSEPATGKTCFRTFMHHLLHDFLVTFPSAAAIKTEFHVPDIELDFRTVQTMGIMVNEMLGNSLKYAFVHKPEGVISLTARRDRKKLTVIYCDNGLGFPDTVSLEQSPGFGLKLVAMLAESINCRISLIRGYGSGFRIVLPLE